MNQLTTPPTESAPTFPCPRCAKPLIDPSGLGWCKACGYCQSLAEGEANAEKPATAAKPNTLNATGSALGQTPTWFWITLAGIVLITAGAWAGGRYLALSPLERAVLASVQMIAGLGVMLVGQFIGLLRIAPEDSALAFKDAIIPFRLYGLVFKRLPNTRHTVYLGAWGLAAIISAGVLVGGLGHWFTYLPNSQKKGPNQVQQKARS